MMSACTRTRWSRVESRPFLRFPKKSRKVFRSFRSVSWSESLNRPSVCQCRGCRKISSEQDGWLEEVGAGSCRGDDEANKLKFDAEQHLERKTHGEELPKDTFEAGHDEKSEYDADPVAEQEFKIRKMQEKNRCGTSIKEEQTRDHQERGSVGAADR